MLYYSFKGFLESSKRKYYLFKLVLVFKYEDINNEGVSEKHKEHLMEEMGKRWESTKNHINQMKEMLIKL